MMRKLKIDKKYIIYGLFIVIVGILLVLGCKIVNNGEAVLSFIFDKINKFLEIISPIFYALILSYLCFKPVMFIQKGIIYIYTKITGKNVGQKGGKVFRMLSIVILFGIIIYLIILTINFILPPIIENLKILIESLPKFADQISIWTNEIVAKLQENNIDVPNVKQLIAPVINNLSSISDNLIGFITTGLTEISSFVLKLFLSIILTFYFLKDKEQLMHNLKYFRDVVIPGKKGMIISKFLKDLDIIVGQYLLGQILDCIIVGIVSTILLLIIHHPFAILIGLVAGFTNIIPYIGPVIGSLLAFCLGVFTSLGMGITGAVLLLLYQQIDGNFIQPKIVGERIGLTPVWFLIVVLIGGSYFGALGMVLSIPVAGLVKIYFNKYAQWKLNKNKQ